MNLLNRIWPWSKIARLEDELVAERYSVRMLLAFLDRAEPGVRHVIFNHRFYSVTVDGMQEVIWVENPRSSYKVEGLSL